MITPDPPPVPRMARGADRDDPSVRRLYDNAALLREELDDNRIPRR